MKTRLAPVAASVAEVDAGVVGAMPAGITDLPVVAVDTEVEEEPVEVTVGVTVVPSTVVEDTVRLDPIRTDPVSLEAEVGGKSNPLGSSDQTLNPSHTPIFLDIIQQFSPFTHHLLAPFDSLSPGLCALLS